MFLCVAEDGDDDDEDASIISWESFSSGANSFCVARKSVMNA